MKALRLLLFLSFWSTSFFGQSESPNNRYTEQDLRELANLAPGSGPIRTIDNRYEGVRGNPFLSEDWQKGTIKLASKDDFGQEVLLMLNLFEQVLYFRLTNGFASSLPSSTLHAFRIYTSPEQFDLFRVYPEAVIEGTNNPKLKFYEVLFEGPFVLLKQHAKTFRAADYKAAYSTNQRYDEFADQSSLWLQEKGKDFVKIKLKRKAIEQALPEYADLIREVMKSEKISLNQEEDLVRLLEGVANKN